MLRLAAFALVALLATPALNPAMAQNAQVDRRQDNQQRRIDAGVAQGTVSPGEQARLERRTGRIEGQEQRMAARNGGTLAPRQQAVLNRELNSTSRQIRRARRS